MRQMREAAGAVRRRRHAEAEINPLRQGLRVERMPDPNAFVLFGATGDLAHRKVMPAIYQLLRANLLPAEFSVVAVARRPYTDEAFRAEVRTSLDKYSRVVPIDETQWTELAKRITYQQLDFADDAGLRKRMVDILKKHMLVDDEVDAEVRRRIKNLEEGTATWEVEYQKALEQIKKNRRLDEK